MNCPKCKSKIPDNVTRCPSCNTKVRVVCAKCGTINVLGVPECTNCGNVLLKFCPKCNAANLPSAELCRKCHEPMHAIDKENKAPIVEQPIPKPQIIPPQVIQNVMPETETKPSEEIEFTEVEETSTEENIPTEQQTTAPENKKNIDNKIVEEPKETPQVQIETENIPTTKNEENQIYTPKSTINNEPIQEKQIIQEFADEDFEYKEQLQAKNIIVDSIKDNTTSIIGLSSEEGLGKTVVLKHVYAQLQNQNYIWLKGECSAITQISPFGFIQDILISFFSIAGYTEDIEKFKRDAKKVFEQNFPSLTSEEQDLLINLLYPTQQDIFENSLINKQKTFELIEKIIFAIKGESKLVFIIENFDLIDGASYEFLQYLINQSKLTTDFKILITYRDKRIIQSYFGSAQISNRAFKNIFLGVLSDQYIDNLIKILLNNENPLPENILYQIYKNAKGIPSYVEQAISLLGEENAMIMENGTIKFNPEFDKYVLPENISLIMDKRLHIMEEKVPALLNILQISSLLGNKFNTAILKAVTEIEDNQLSQLLSIAMNSGYIVPINEQTFIFKNAFVWKYIYETTKNSDMFIAYNAKIIQVISNLTLSNNSIKALALENIDQKTEALDIWTENIKIAAFIGDTNLYTISQKQCLKLLDEIEVTNGTTIKNNIYERVGKLLYKTNPEHALEYLSNAIINAKQQNQSIKIIELSGYLARSADILGNYFGVIESVDMVLSQLNQNELPLECALIKTRKLKALLSLGSLEEIINLIDNDINPILEETLSDEKIHGNIPADLIYESWLESNLTLANALSQQGNNRSFEVLNVILEVINANKIENKHYISKIKLAYALANTLLGDINSSEIILQELSKIIPQEELPPSMISSLNIINTLNLYFKGDFNALKKNLYHMVSFAHNCNDSFGKNILKTILAKIIKENGDTNKANDVLTEEITYFAEEKIAIGALLCWYYLAEISFIKEGTDTALDIAQNALEVAKNPKINNYLFAVLYKKFIAEIYITKGDLESAKMYIEKALLITKKYGLKLLEAKLYILYGKYLEEIVTKDIKNTAEQAPQVIQIYEKAIETIHNLGLANIEEEARNSQTNFRTFCQLNNIKV